MVEDGGTFTKLMEMQKANAAATTKDSPPPEPTPAPGPSGSSSATNSEPAAPELRPGLRFLLPELVEDTSATGSKSHSFRLSLNESLWLRRFCDHLSVEMDRNVSGNLLTRLLLRLAQIEWLTDPDANRLRDLINEAPEP